MLELNQPRRLYKNPQLYRSVMAGTFTLPGRGGFLQPPGFITVSSIVSTITKQPPSRRGDSNGRRGEEGGLLHAITLRSLVKQ